MAKGEAPITPEVIKPPGNSTSERARAYRINRDIKEKKSVSEDDLKWLTEYRKAQHSRGASRSHKVSYTEEMSEAAAEGDSVAVAAALAAPQLAREEGRRIDNLIKEATNATTNANKMVLAACELLMKFATSAFERNGAAEANVVKMLDTFRTSHIEMTHAHAALVRQDAEHEAEAITREAEDAAAANEESGGMVEGIIQQFLPVIMEEMRRRASGKPVEGK